MTISKVETITRYLDPTTVVLLEELGTECEVILNLLAQLETPELREEQIEDVLGDLSAAVLHMHVHTEGLDDCILGDSTPDSE